MLIRLNVATKRTSRAEAQREIGNLVDEYPEIIGLRLSAALVVGSAPYDGEVLTALEQLATEYPGNADVQEALGVALCRHRRTPGEVWECFRSVLAQRPLVQSARAAAYRIAREVAPAEAADALRGSGSVARLLLRTRARGGWIRVLLAPLLLGIILALFNLPLGMVVLSVGTLSAGWLAASSSAACCWRCVALASAAVLLSWGSFGADALVSSSAGSGTANRNVFSPSGFATAASTGSCPGVVRTSYASSTGQHIIAVARFRSSTTWSQMVQFAKREFAAPGRLGNACSGYSMASYAGGLDLLWVTGSLAQKQAYEGVVESRLRHFRFISGVEGGKGLWYARNP